MKIKNDSEQADPPKKSIKRVKAEHVVVSEEPHSQDSSAEPVEVPVGDADEGAVDEEAEEDAGDEVSESHGRKSKRRARRDPDAKQRAKFGGAYNDLAEAPYNPLRTIDVLYAIGKVCKYFQFFVVTILHTFFSQDISGLVLDQGLSIASLRFAKRMYSAPTSTYFFHPLFDVCLFFFFLF